MIDYSQPFRAQPYPVSGLAQILQAVAQQRNIQTAQAQAAQERQKQEAYQRLALLHSVAYQYTSAGQEPPQEILGALSQTYQALGLPGIQQQTTTTPGPVTQPAVPGAPAVPAIPPGPGGGMPMQGPMGAQPADVGAGSGAPAIPATPGTPEARGPGTTSQQYVLPGAAQRAATLAAATQTIGDFAKGIGMTLRPGVNPDTPTAELRRQGVNLESLFVPAAGPPETHAFFDTRTGQMQTVQFPAGTKVSTYTSPGAQPQHVIIYPDGTTRQLPPGVIPTFAPDSVLPTRVAIVNPQTGATQMMTLPPGTKVQIYTPPQPREGPAQHMLVFPDGHREMLPPGVVPTMVPARTVPQDQVSPADREVLQRYFSGQGAKMFTTPAAQAAFQKRVQQALTNVGINVPDQLPPQNSSWWDSVKQWWAGVSAPTQASPGAPAGAPGAPGVPAPAPTPQPVPVRPPVPAPVPGVPPRPAPLPAKGTYQTLSSGTVTATQVRSAIANMVQQGLNRAQIRQRLQQDRIPPGDFSY